MHGYVQVVKGIVEGCRQSDCALLGGEVRPAPAFRLNSKESQQQACLICFVSPN